MDGVGELDEYEDFALEGSDGVVLSNFVKAQTEIKNVLPEIGTACVSNYLLNPPASDGELEMHISPRTWQQRSILTLILWKWKWIVDI
jgi:predicted polyphosphate/ATP-dependent NAD kinase